LDLCGKSDDKNKKIEELNEENRRLNYRIKQLVKGIEELQDKKVLFVRNLK